MASEDQTLDEKITLLFQEAIRLKMIWARTKDSRSTIDAHKLTFEMWIVSGSVNYKARELERIFEDLFRDEV
jgi:hypothetical protein